MNQRITDSYFHGIILFAGKRTKQTWRVRLDLGQNELKGSMEY